MCIRDRDYISKISFDGDECDQILELVERKYKENQSKKEPRKEDSGLQKRLRISPPDIPFCIFSSVQFHRSPACLYPVSYTHLYPSVVILESVPARSLSVVSASLSRSVPSSDI